MRKQFFAVCLCLLAAIAAVGMFVGCASETNSETVSGGEMGTLELNKKYIHEADVRLDEAVQRYFLFTTADTGKYHYYYEFYGEISSYTITFHYKIVGEMANCFFDSVEYDAVDTEKNASTAWSYTLGVDVDFLMKTNGTYYINEDYLDKIPNFGADDVVTV